MGRGARRECGARLHTLRRESPLTLHPVHQAPPVLAGPIKRRRVRRRGGLALAPPSQLPCGISHRFILLLPWTFRRFVCSARQQELNPVFQTVLRKCEHHLVKFWWAIPACCAALQNLSLNVAPSAISWLRSAQTISVVSPPISRQLRNSVGILAMRSALPPQSIARMMLFPFQGRIQAGSSAFKSTRMKIGSILRPLLPSWRQTI